VKGGFLLNECHDGLSKLKDGFPNRRPGMILGDGGFVPAVRLLDQWQAQKTSTTTAVAKAGDYDSSSS
jgi:hypothetical protein